MCHVDGRRPFDQCHKLVSADTVTFPYTVKYFVDDLTTALDVQISSTVTEVVIDIFEVVEIKINDSNKKRGTLADSKNSHSMYHHMCHNANVGYVWILYGYLGRKHIWPARFPYIYHNSWDLLRKDSDLCKIHLTEPVPDFALVLVEGLHEHCKRKGEQNQRQERQVGSNQIVL
mgnify:CR=1 FL=1